MGSNQSRQPSTEVDKLLVDMLKWSSESRAKMDQETADLRTAKTVLAAEAVVLNQLLSQNPYLKEILRKEQELDNNIAFYEMIKTEKSYIEIEGIIKHLMARINSFVTFRTLLERRASDHSKILADICGWETSIDALTDSEAKAKLVNLSLKELSSTRKCVEEVCSSDKRFAKSVENIELKLLFLVNVLEKLRELKKPKAAFEKRGTLQ